VIFRKNGTGVNPIIYAYGGGTATPIDQKQDGFWRLIGADWITIDGIDLWDANFGGSPDMEFGYGLFKASAANGCQNNTIKNCAILMRRSNNAFGTGTASDGSRGIEVVNALTTAHTTSISVTSAAGSNSYNKFYSNYITDGNISIALVGYATTSPFTNVDMFNDIGGSSTATGNTFINFGGGGTAAPAAGIQAEGQYSLNVRYNWVDNNANGTGVNHPGTLRGIYLKAATSASAVVSNNTISVRSAGSGVQLTAIENASGSTPASNAITIANNLITACSYTGAISGVFTGILSTGSPATLNITGNQLVGNSTAGNG